MAKLDLEDVGSLTNTISARQIINENSVAIEAAVENTLSRDGTAPNQMEADFDMNEFNILNLRDPQRPMDGVNLRTVLRLITAGGGVTDNIVSVKDFGAVGDGLSDDTNAIQLAVDSGLSFYFPSGTYPVSGGGVTGTLDRQRVYGLNDSTIRVDGLFGLNLTSMRNSVIQGLRFLGTSETDGRAGIQVGGLDVSAIHDNEFKNLESGVIATAKTREAWFGGLNYVPAAISNNRVQNCGTGIALMDMAEYIAVSDNQIFACTVAGIYSEAGNSPIQDNLVVACEWGIHVKGNGPSGVTLDNPEHSSISCNTVNHSKSCGIYLEDIFLSTLLTGNQVWATDTLGTFLSYGKSFGLFIKSGRRITSAGNVYSESAYNVGFDGMAECSFDDAIQHTAQSLAFYLWCEGNGEFSDNRNVSITLAPSNWNPTDIIGNYTSADNRLFRIKTRALAQGVDLDASVLIDYKIDGRHDEVIISESYAQGLLVPDYMKGISFSLNVNGVTTPKTVTFPTGSTLSSSTSGCVVTSNTCTIRGDLGRYTFTATPNQGSWIVTYEGKPQSPVYNVTASGTAYTLTTSTVQVDFGTTDPIITITQPGTYVMKAVIQVDAVAATVGTTQNLDIRMRRTNNTAADVDQMIIDLQPLTAQTVTVGTWTMEQVYTTLNNNDVIGIFGGLSAALGAGSMQVKKAILIATKVH